MPTDLAPHDRARLRYARPAYLLAYEMELVAAVAAGTIGRNNAWLNLHEMTEDWPTQDIIDWAESRGLKPMWIALEPLQGPVFPPVAARHRHHVHPRDGVRPSKGHYTEGHRNQRSYLYNDDGTCPHIWLVSPIGGGVACNDCPAWRCM